MEDDGVMITAFDAQLYPVFGRSQGSYAIEARLLELPWRMPPRSLESVSWATTQYGSKCGPRSKF
jgi:hypothetical protein